MLFNSPEFLFIFLPVTLLVYWRLVAAHGASAAFAWLTFASLAFYAWWDWRYGPMLLVSIAVNYTLGRRLANRRERYLLVTGVCLNLALLGFFKYTDFFIGVSNSLFNDHRSLLQSALPLGISFFTFQKIAYLVDCYRGEVRDQQLGRFTLFVLFFPQLIAGPIVHHRAFTSQLDVRPVWLPQQVATGLFLLLLGLFKKLIVADTIARCINPLWSPSLPPLQLYEAWTATLGYTLQLYFDFSAYSEMAMGIALLFGLRLPQNFNSPYQAATVQAFWRRWHMTLSAFLRDYVYLPLGGNRRGAIRSMFAAMTTMIVGGFWHGAGWTFLLWGLLHGLYIVVYRIWLMQPWRLPPRAAVLVTLVSVVFAWVMFKAVTVDQAISVWRGLLGLNGVTLPSAFSATPLPAWLGLHVVNSGLLTGVELLAFAVLLMFALTQKNAVERADAIKPTWQRTAQFSALALVATFSLSLPSAFLYFQF